MLLAGAPGSVPGWTKIATPHIRIVHGFQIGLRRIFLQSILRRNPQCLLTSPRLPAINMGVVIHHFAYKLGVIDVSFTILLTFTRSFHRI